MNGLLVAQRAVEGLAAHLAEPREHHVAEPPRAPHGDDRRTRAAVLVARAGIAPRRRTRGGAIAALVAPLRSQRVAPPLKGEHGAPAEELLGALRPGVGQPSGAVVRVARGFGVARLGFRLRVKNHVGDELHLRLGGVVRQEELAARPQPPQLPQHAHAEHVLARGDARLGRGVATIAAAGSRRIAAAIGFCGVGGGRREGADPFREVVEIDLIPEQRNREEGEDGRECDAEMPLRSGVRTGAAEAGARRHGRSLALQKISARC